MTSRNREQKLSKNISYLLAGSLLLSLSQQPLVFAASDAVVKLNNDGVNALKVSNYAAAVDAFQKCLKLDPTYKLAKENMAICYNNWGISLANSPQQAIDKFHKSLFYSPDNPTAVQNLEVTIQNLGKDPKNFKDRVALGKAARLAGDLEGGIIEFSEALKLKDDPALRVELGNAYYVRDRVDDAIAQYNIAAKSPSLDPDTKAKIYRSLGQAYQAKKDYPHSVAAYNEAITLNRTDRETLEANKAVWLEAVQKDPTNPDNHVGLGQAYMYLGDFDQAQAELRTALTMNPRNGPATTLLAKIPQAKREFERDKHINNGVDLQSRKLYDAAIQEYQAALAQDTMLPPDAQDAADIWLNIASANQAMEKYDVAVSCYQKALQKNPDLPGAKEGLKICQDRIKSKQLDQAATDAANFFKSGNYQEALSRYQMLLNNNPKDPAGHFNLGATYQGLKQLDNAINEYKQAISLAPDNQQYKDALTKAYQDKADPIIDLAVKKHADKDYTSAIDLYQQALAIVPNNIKVQFNLAGAYYSRQQFPEAQALYDKLYKQDPKGQVDDLWLIGTILENSKNGSAALATYTKYVTESPSGKYVAQAKERIDALRKDPNDVLKIKSEAEIAQDKTADDAYKQGVAAQQGKRWDEANKFYMQALSIHPKDAAIAFALGTMFQQKGDSDSALKWFQSAIDLGTADAKFDKKTLDEFKKALKLAKEEKARPLVEEAVKRQSGGTPNDQVAAIDLYKQALQWVPNNARIWTNLGQAYQLIDDFKNAQSSYQKAVDLDAKNESTDWYLIAKIDENYGDGNAAIQHYRKYLLAEPSGKYATDANARLAVLTKNPGATAKLPTQAEMKSDKLAEDEYNAGLAAQNAGKPGEALPHYQKAAGAKPNESAYLEAIATCYQQLKDYDNALSFYDQSIAMATKNGRTKDVEIYKKQRTACAEDKAAPIVDKALAAYNNKDFKSAADLYGQAIQVVPNIASMHTSRAAAMQAMDDFQGALDEYQKGYDLNPKEQIESLYLIGALQENFGRGTQALDTYRKYLAQAPNGQYKQLALQRTAVLAKNPGQTIKIPTTGERQKQEQITGLYNEAIDAYNKKDFQTCISKMQAVLGIANDAVYHYQLGAAYLGLQNFDNAKSEFAAAMKLDPSNKTYKDILASTSAAQIDPIVNEAVKKQTAGDLPGAIEGYRKALQIDPNLANVYTNLASALQASEDFAGARAEFDKALQLDRKGQIGNLYFIGVLDENFGKGPQALQEYMRYVQEAGAGGAYTGLAQQKIKKLQANPNDTEKIVTQADAAKSAAINQAYQDGIAAQQKGDFDTAIQKYSEAAQANPNEAAYWGALGTAFDNKGDLDNAIKNYEKAISLNPKEKSFKDYMKSARQRKAAPLIQEAYTKQTTKDDKGNFDLAGAIVSYENALKWDDDAGTHMNLGTAYQANGNLPKALENYKKSVQMAPNDPNMAEAYYYMGTVYEAMKQPALAIPEYKKYLLKAANGPSAAAVKERLKALGAK
jgi:tetratricopeptide (TPR) repeat protein